MPYSTLPYEAHQTTDGLTEYGLLVRIVLLPCITRSLKSDDSVLLLHLSMFVFENRQMLFYRSFSVDRVPLTSFCENISINQC